MIDDKIGPAFRSRYLEDYAPVEATDASGNATSGDAYASKYGYSGEDPYKAELLAAAAAAAGGGAEMTEEDVKAYEQWAQADPEGYAAAYYAHWAETDPEGYAAYYYENQNQSS